MIPGPVSKFTIANFLVGLGIQLDRIQLPAQQYMLPSKRWITDVFLPWLATEQERTGTWKYQGQAKWVCVNFARFAAEQADEIYLGTDTATADAAAAMGEFWYFAHGPNQPGHAIGMAICRRPSTDLEMVMFGRQMSSELELVLFEPQPPPHLVQLTPEEITTCDSARF